MFHKIGILKNVRNIHKKTPVLESLFNKIAGLSPVTLLNKRLQTWYYVIDAPTLLFSSECLRTPFLKNTSGGCLCLQELWLLKASACGSNKFSISITPRKV